MKKPLLATVVFCGLMGGATAGPTAAEDNKSESGLSPWLHHKNV
jgi:hypothetical protein